MYEFQVILRQMQMTSNEQRKDKYVLELHMSKITGWMDDLSNDLQGSVGITYKRGVI